MTGHGGLASCRRWRRRTTSWPPTAVALPRALAMMFHFQSLSPSRSTSAAQNAGANHAQRRPNRGRQPSHQEPHTRSTGRRANAWTIESLPHQTAERRHQEPPRPNAPPVGPGTSSPRAPLERNAPPSHPHPRRSPRWRSRARHRSGRIAAIRAATPHRGDRQGGAASRRRPRHRAWPSPLPLRCCSPRPSTPRRGGGRTSSPSWQQRLPSPAGRRSP
mmetsp:Transcript_33417/g.95914  ORF Transcript_33417/g.95914 Transcript_33417/m.95914 type:complete len:218 (-) Transcript_33417:45-698(-)